MLEKFSAKLYVLYFRPATCIVKAQDKPEIKLVEHCVTIIICLLGKKVRKNEVEILDT
jgi:hypothetical protein